MMSTGMKRISNPGNMVRFIYERTDSTSESGLFEVDKNTLASIQPGWYLIEFKAKDKDGEEIVDKRYIQLIRQGVKSGNVGYNLVPFEFISAEPTKYRQYPERVRCKGCFCNPGQAGNRGYCDRFFLF